MVNSYCIYIILMNDIYQASIEFSDGVNETRYVDADLLGGTLEVGTKR